MYILAVDTNGRENWLGKLAYKLWKNSSLIYWHKIQLCLLISCALVLVLCVGQTPDPVVHVNVMAQTGQKLHD